VRSLATQTEGWETMGQLQLALQFAGNLCGS